MKLLKDQRLLKQKGIGRLELFRTDGGSSVTLAYKNPDDKFSIPFRGSKHTGKKRGPLHNYVIHTYIMFKVDKPR